MLSVLALDKDTSPASTQWAVHPGQTPPRTDSSAQQGLSGLCIRGQTPVPSRDSVGCAPRADSSAQLLPER